MALDAQLMLVGARQGLITGPSATETRVFFTGHKIVCPRSPATGLSTGKRHHKPLIIGKEINAASIGIQRALTENEPLTEVRLRFFQPSPQGVPKQHFTIQLFNAAVCAVRTILPNTRSQRMKVGVMRGGHEFIWEEVSFTYLTIQWTWNDPLRVNSDDWLVAR